MIVLIYFGVPMLREYISVRYDFLLVLFRGFSIVALASIL